MEDLAYKKVLKLDKSIYTFCINKQQTISDAIQAFERSKGFPLIVINQNNELIGSLSNGDIRKYLSHETSNLNSFVVEALNTILSERGIRVNPVNTIVTIFPPRFAIF